MALVSANMTRTNRTIIQLSSSTIISHLSDTHTLDFQRLHQFIHETICVIIIGKISPFLSATDDHINPTRRAIAVAPTETCFRAAAAFLYSLQPNLVEKRLPQWNLGVFGVRGKIPKITVVLRLHSTTHGIHDAFAVRHTEPLQQHLQHAVKIV